jgi:hypothetical protein
VCEYDGVNMLLYSNLAVVCIHNIMCLEVFIHDRDGKLQRQGQGSKTHLDNEEVVTLPKKTVYSPPSADEEVGTTT